MKPTELTLVPLPFSARRHPEAGWLEQYVRGWVLEHGLLPADTAARTLEREGCGDCAAWLFPSAPLPDAELAAAWLTWLFLVDDQFEESADGSAEQWTAVAGMLRTALAPLYGRADPVAAGRVPSADLPPLAASLHELCGRLGARGGPRWGARFAEHVRETLDAVREESGLCAQGTPPPLARYVPLRRRTGGFYAGLDLVELCAGADLPDAVRETSAYRQYREAAVDVVSWTNDLCSVEKEEAGGTVTNLVLVLGHEHGFDRARAVRDAYERTCRRMDDLTAAERVLTGVEAAETEPDRAAVRRYVAAVRDAVAGADAWHATGPRRYATTPAPS